MPLEVIMDVSNMLGLICGVLVIIVTISLNMFIIFSVVLDKSMRNYTNVQFASMSIADTLVACVAMPLLLASHSIHGTWPYNENVCILFIVGDFVGGNISIITLTMISWHRLDCIRKPYLMQKSKRMIEFLLPAFIIWPLVFSFWTVLAVYIVKVHNRFMRMQDCFFLYSFEYVVVVDLVAYVVPISLLVYFQIAIYVALRNKNNFIKPVTSITSIHEHSQHRHELNSSVRTLVLADKPSTSSDPNNNYTTNSNNINNTTKSSTSSSKRPLKRSLTLSLMEYHQSPKSSPTHKKPIVNFFLSKSTKQQQQQIRLKQSPSSPSIQITPAPAGPPQPPVAPVSSTIQSSFISEEDESINMNYYSPTTTTSNRVEFSLPIVELTSVVSTSSMPETTPPAAGLTNSSVRPATPPPTVKKPKQPERRLIRSASMRLKSPHQLKTAAAAAIAAHHYTKNKKAFRILCLVTCSLIVFWMPWIVSWPVQAYCHCMPRFYYALTYWLEYANSLVNSVILIVFNQHFRKKFLALFFNFKS